jgi:hypothetical protein
LIMSSYASLTVPQALDADTRATWFQVVEQHVPSGLISTTELMIKNKPVQSRYYTRVTPKGSHSYVIPLARDLDASEVHQVLRAWCKIYPQGDFSFDWSQPSEHSIARPDDIKQKVIGSVMDSWSKTQHQQWKADLERQGWRYGITVSVANRTHPWLQPWESLPQAAKQRQFDAVQSLLDLLHEQGYTITQQHQG